MLWSSLVRIHGFLLAFLGIVVGIILYAIVPQSTVTRVLVAVATFLVVLAIIAFITLFDAARTLYDTEPNVLPKVRSGMQPFEGTDAALVCMTDPSDLFSFGILVSFYRVDEQEVEVPIGFGTVTNVQQNGKILIEMNHVLRGQEDFVERLRNNDGRAIAVTLVKPYFPQRMLSVFGGPV